ncbi:hypothetical protein WJ972_09470 [Achromobacter insuavis]
MLEYLRGKTGHLIGLTSAALSTVKSTHFTHSGDSSRESTRTCWEACEEALKALELIQLLVEQVAPNRERMVARAADDFSTVTDLADLLVRQAGASFRDAHHIIGAVVRQALEQGLPARAIPPAMIAAAAEQQLGRPVALAADAIAACLDPVRNVAARLSPGGPAPQSVRAHLREQHAVLDARQASIDAARQRAADARETLQRRAHALVHQENGMAAA